MHNQRTMKKMKELLEEGGRIIYVALSGGRDRPDEYGNVQVAEFDAQSLEMFRLMAKQSHKPCHFYPLALATFDILPPPPVVEKELGKQEKQSEKEFSSLLLMKSIWKSIQVVIFPTNMKDGTFGNPCLVSCQKGI